MSSKLAMSNHPYCEGKDGGILELGIVEQIYGAAAQGTCNVFPLECDSMTRSCISLRSTCKHPEIPYKIEESMQ